MRNNIIKVFLIFLILFIGISFGFAENKDIVDLKGKLGVNQLQTLEAFKGSNEVTINFLDCIGNLTVTIVNENGITVYNETVNSYVIGSISINVQNLPSGWYKITVSDTQGGWVEGSFFIEN
jgi:hypothetical protein